MLRSSTVHHYGRIRLTKSLATPFSLQRLSFSNQSTPNTDASSLFRMTRWLDPWESFGLTHSSIVQQPSLQQSLIQLPEVIQSLNDQPSDLSVESLERAVEIFASMQPGGQEHQALLALMAEVQQHVGDYSGAHTTLQELEDHAIDLPVLVMLARSKSLWMNGDFEASRALCDEQLNDDKWTMNTSNSTQVFVAASGRTGQALSRLLTVHTLDDIFSVRDPFRMVVKSLESSAPSSLALVAAHLNSGIAEAVYAQVLENERETGTVPLDGAMRSWKQGMTILERRSRSHNKKKNKNAQSSSPHYMNSVAQALEARLQANMAWGLLEMVGERDHVKQASEFASRSLKVHDENKNNSMGGWIQTLALVARCYHKSGGAVTAEGLFQSAITTSDSSPEKPKKQTSPLELLDRRDALLGYANLCADWEKRAGDAERLRTEASEIDASLPGGWKTKSGIHGSLWFWLPMHF